MMTVIVAVPFAMMPPPAAVLNIVIKLLPSLAKSLSLSIYFFTLCRSITYRFMCLHPMLLSFFFNPVDESSRVDFVGTLHGEHRKSWLSVSISVEFSKWCSGITVGQILYSRT